MNIVNIVYEDNHILVVIKPQNIPTQQDSSGDEDLVTAIKSLIKERDNKPGKVYLGLLHRLDRPTGGLMIFAKTSKAASRISEDFRLRKISKKYIVVTSGNLQENRGTLVNYLKKDPINNIVEVVRDTDIDAKSAELEYLLISKIKDLNLLEINLKTGRSHQIRVQLAHINNPVVNDFKYGGTISNKNKYLSLWSYQIKFTHPVSKKVMNFISSPPADEFPWDSFNLDSFINKNI